MNPLVPQLEQLVRDYLVSRSDTLLVSIYTVGLQLLAQGAALSDADRGRVVDALAPLFVGMQPLAALAGSPAAAFGAQLPFAASIAAPVASLTTQLTLVATPFGTQLAFVATSTGLVAGGGAAPGSTIAIAPGGVTPAAFGGGGGFAVGPLILPGALVVGVLAFYVAALYALYLAFQGVKEALRAVQALATTAVDLFRRFFVDRIFDEAIALGVGPCAFVRFDRILIALREVFQRILDALKAGNAPAPGYLAALFATINVLLEDFVELLVECGLERPLLIAKIAALKQALKAAFNLNGAGLPAGPALSTVLLEQARNGLRQETVDGNVSGFHRRGGMSYEEFGDDSADNPDITNEDPTAPVGIEEVDVDPNLNLGAFTDAQLKLRKETLQRFVDELVATIAELDAEIARLRGSNDPGDRDRLGRLLVARDQAAKDLRKTKAALRNAHIEHRTRLLDSGQRAMAAEILVGMQMIDPRNPERVLTPADTEARRAAVRNFLARPLSEGLG